MVKFCSLRACVNRDLKSSKDGNVTHHTFPEDSERKEKWAEFINIHNRTTDFKIPLYRSSAYLCCLHFDKSCYKGTKKLIKAAVPSIAPAFTPEVALKFGLIPALDSSLLETVNNFDISVEDYLKAAANHAESLQAKKSDVEGPRRNSNTSMDVDMFENAHESRPTASPAKERLERNASIDEGTPSKSSEPRTPISRKRKFHVGDITPHDYSTPRRAKTVVEFMKKTVYDSRKNLKACRMRLKRALHKVNDLTSLLKHLTDDRRIPDDLSAMLQNVFPAPAAEVLKRALRSQKNEVLHPEVKKFALTLHFHSPAAYDYVRKSFMYGLPHPKHLSKLYSALDGNPGFSQQAKDAINNRAKEVLQKQKKKLYCSLMVDEMYVRKRGELGAGLKVTGFADESDPSDPRTLKDDSSLATQAWVFMLVGINDSWKMPIGYFFINSLDASQRASMLDQCLHFLEDCDVTVTSLTFDGNKVNITAAELLGAGMQPFHNWHPWFAHPITGDKVFVVLDAAHMLKLWRNSCGNTTLHITDKDNNEIKWSYFEKLNAFQEVEGLRAGNKVSKRHIHWKKEAMKVRLAAQLLSLSTADALTYLSEDLKLPEFQGCEATVKFIKMADTIFDVLNSRNLNAGKKQNRPISFSNIALLRNIYEEAFSYVKGLKVSQRRKNGSLTYPVPIVETEWKTGFVGFLTGLEMVIGMFETYVQTGLLKFVPTYKLSQDHLETFFSAIRSRGGWNPNPSLKNFIAAYKRLLVQVQFKVDKEGANCWPLECIDILNVSVTSSKKKIYEDEDLDDDKILNEHDYAKPLQDLSEISVFVQDVVVYIAGFVSRSVGKQLSCKLCAAAIIGNSTNCSLLLRKNRGGLCIPSDDVVKICKATERSIRTQSQQKQLLTTSLPQHIVRVKRALASDPFQSLQHPDLHFMQHCEHRNNLITAVVKKYMVIRVCHDLKRLNEMNTPEYIRSRLTKTIIFKNQ